jgi:hypothetical protein
MERRLQPRSVPIQYLNFRAEPLPKDEQGQRFEKQGNKVPKPDIYDRRQFL